VVHVTSIEQLSNDKVDIFLWCQSEWFLVIVDEYQGLVDRSVIVDIVGLSFPIFMGDYVVSSSRVEGGCVLCRVGPLELWPWVGGSGDLVPSERRGCGVPRFDLDRGVSDGWVIDTYHQHLVFSRCGRLTPWEDIVGIRLVSLVRGREWLLLSALQSIPLLRSPGNIIGPVDNPDQFARVDINISLVPILLHFNLKLPHHPGYTSIDLSVHQPSGNRVDYAGDIKTSSGYSLGWGLGRSGLGSESMFGMRLEIIGRDWDQVLGGLKFGKEMSESLGWSQDLVTSEGGFAKSRIMVFGFSKSVLCVDDFFRDFTNFLTT